MMIIRLPITTILVFIVFSSSTLCEDQLKSTVDDRIASTAGDASSGAEYQGYGKRPSGHSFVRFGKRGDNPKSHSFMYFGKRGDSEETTNNIAELLQYLQKTQEPSWKRGHSILRFGKRGQDNKHNFIRFGKREDDEGDVDKRASHSMMYFGKRNGHSMIYFGKRQPDEDESMADLEKKAGHSMMYFGKRPDDGMGKKASHSMMYFGKRSYPEEDMDKRAGHSMMYFGKRMDSDEDMDKRAGHSMMYFGKRDESLSGDESFEPDEEKRATHQMIRFGKRSAGFNDYWLRNGNPFSSYGNRYFVPLSTNMAASRRGPSVDKKKHNMMHFGKRSVDDPMSSESMKASQETTTSDKLKEPEHERPKREIDSSEPVLPFVPFIPVYDPESSLESLDYSSMDDPGQFLIPSKEVKSDSKNEFMRFGKH